MSTENNLPIKLAKPAQRALAGAGINKLVHFTKFSETEIKALHGMGPNGMMQIKKALIDNGLSFRKMKK